jgi:DNA-binding PadR family transcriptional regulator
MCVGDNRGGNRTRRNRAISKRSFAADHDIGPGMLVPTLKRLRQLGFIEIEKGAAPAVASSFN